MRITPLEIRDMVFKKTALGGYDRREVESFRETMAEALEEAKREITRLEEKVRDLEEKLAEHVANESLLKETITTTQRMSGDIKENARKEAELIIAEARMRADEIVKQAQTRVTEINGEIMRLKAQRAEFESSLKAILDYHSAKLLIEEEEAERADAEAEKVKFFPGDAGNR